MTIIGYVIDNLKSAILNLTVGDLKAGSVDIAKSYKYLNDDKIHLGLDIDGTITEWPNFFKQLSRMWPGKVSIISYRSNLEETKELLKSLDIYYDEVILVGSLDKSSKIVELGVDVYIDDQDECMMNIPSSVTVLKIRNGGNFDNGKWLYSDYTGKSIT